MALLPPRGDRIVTLLSDPDIELTCAEICLKLAYQELDPDMTNQNSKDFFAKNKARKMSASVSGLLYRMKKSNVLTNPESKGIKGGMKYKLNVITNEISDIRH